MAFIGKIKKKELIEGINFINDFKDKIIIYKEKEEIKGCLNICKHQGGTFIKKADYDKKQTTSGSYKNKINYLQKCNQIDIEDIHLKNCNIVKCRRHGWELDCKNMKYITNEKKQDQLFIEDKDDYINIYRNIDKFWDYVKVVKKTKYLPLEKNELTITYFSHAFVQIKAGDISIITDPWIEGPAFSMGWWRLHKLPSNYIKAIEDSEYLYLSHHHTDHCAYNSLKKIKEINSDIQILVGNISKPVIRGKINDLGLNINVINLYDWYDINNYTRLSIFPDGVYDDMDTGLIFEYKVIK